MHLCLDSSAALCNACQLKINRHTAANLKASQALELHTVHANLEPQRSCYHCTSYAQQAFSWSNHPEAGQQKHRACYLNRNLAVMVFLHCFSFIHVNLACQAEAWPGKCSYLLSLPLHPTGSVCNVLCGASSGNMCLSPHHLKEIGNPGYPFLEHCFSIIGLSQKML